MKPPNVALLLFLIGLGIDSMRAQETSQPAAHAEPAESALRSMLERFDVDRKTLERSSAVPMSPKRVARFAAFQAEWKKRLDAVPFDDLDVTARIDHVLMRAHLELRNRQLADEARRDVAVQPLLPFWRTIVDLAEARRRIDPVDPKAAATQVEGLRAAIEKARASLPERGKVTRSVARRAVRRGRDLERALADWHDFRAGYDPQFTWWLQAPYRACRDALRAHVDRIERRLVGSDEGRGADIVGEPIGRDALQVALATEMIPYSPDELLQIARKEYEWCRQQMLAASRNLGFGEDWRKALRHVKTLHVPPGQQPALIKKLALEAEAFLDARDLVTIPPLCRETWRMKMMTPARQRVNPYFTGGEVISVSFPTQGMSHEDKLMSLKGNNEHFSRATVHHELIPGHHLQMFMTARYRTWRRPFDTPFWLEGWALYWEMRLWDLGFPRSAEDRVGMLFWRMHRCARIVFSLSFHLEIMSPMECIAYLVEDVGHEPRNAAAEVRRSVQGGYPPLYQAAYMLGGLQIRALHAEMVGEGKMTERAFHDRLLREGSIPIELIRAALRGDRISKDHVASWRFYPLK